jgi:hypothetical protein
MPVNGSFAPEMVIPQELALTQSGREEPKSSVTIPVHSHLIAQGFLDLVEQRRKSRLPLFYNTARRRGATNANPQWQKVAERLSG